MLIWFVHLGLPFGCLIRFMGDLQLRVCFQVCLQGGILGVGVIFLTLVSSFNPAGLSLAHLGRLEESDAVLAPFRSGPDVAAELPDQVLNVGVALALMGQHARALKYLHSLLVSWGPQSLLLKCPAGELGPEVSAQPAGKLCGWQGSGVVKHLYNLLVSCVGAFQPAGENHAYPQGLLAGDAHLHLHTLLCCVRGCRVLLLT